ncbi:sodium- and chloride-dependent glycine transporter 2-like [Penaeus japonicus]|uniref:sodium- and chloride-dependent glycine transporter 2-like n=1 Tax=Penaeus japonicus TaxID=27405 RepID=UPI001C711050|nr:sodium- and chloride-dependent glycine transporter 2-like [Penaeus japonicus]XP_042873250.1 sodium- and chloride-dependent glycine transporter 2-like [Penaeus japonicus]XP_042873251.1 sodium- and chloride-dependent glycine transporter 2-like [Penaeus japonicus]
MGKEDKKDVGSTEALEAEEERGTWGNQCEFFLSCLGYAVGFGNVWRFPYLCYKNGGAAFLIPYVIMLLCAGLPLFFMELALGQYVSLGPNILFPKLAPIFSGLGWGMIVVSALVAVYYNLILAWTLFYTFASFTSVLPWGNCDNDFNSIECFTEDAAANCRNQSLFYYHKECIDLESYCGIVNMTGFNQTYCAEDAEGTMMKAAEGAIPRISASEDYFKNRMLGVTGTSWDDMGSMRWELVGCLALAWLIVGACLAKGVKSSGKVVYFTALFPYAVLVILFIRGVTLEGAQKGIDFYLLRPNISRLAEIEVWNDAATQIFYSLGSSFGGLITLASYNKFKNNCMRDAIIIAFANCSTSVFAGFVIFSILGFLATELGVEVQDVVSSGSGLAFVVYPAAVTRMPVPPLWAILFFAMLITLGLDSQFTMVETLSTALFDQFESLRSRKPLVVFSVCFGLFLAGLTMCLEGGIYMFELFNWYSAGLSVIILAITEIVVVQYIYGFKNFMRNIREEMNIYMPLPLYGYWAATWLVITPLSLAIIFLMSVYYFVPAYWGTYTYPNSIQTLGWFICVSSIIFIPLGAIYVVWKGNKKGKELIMASPDFCPHHIRQLREKKGAATKGHPEGVFRYTYDNEGYQEGAAKVYPTMPTEEVPPPYTNGSGGYSNHM